MSESENRETIAEIVAEMREKSAEYDRLCREHQDFKEQVLMRDWWHNNVVTFRTIADRIEAAWKRDEAQSVQPKTKWSLTDAFAFANTLANHGWTSGANPDAASSCIYALCRMLKDGGNAAAMREALLSLRAWAKTVKENPKDKTAVECAEFVEQTAKEAIKKPPRIVDAYTDWRDALKAAIAKCESWRPTACIECPWFIPHTTGACLMRRLYSEVKNEIEVNDEQK